MARLRTALLLAFGAHLWPSPARADAPPPPGYVETCVLEKQRQPGEECQWCNTYAGGGGSRKCVKELEPLGFRGRCSTRGASTWSELWCKPIGYKPPTRASAEPLPAPEPEPPWSEKPFLPENAPALESIKLPPPAPGVTPLGDSPVVSSKEGIRPVTIAVTGLAIGALLAVFLNRIIKIRLSFSALAGFVVFTLAALAAVGGALRKANDLANTGANMPLVPSEYGHGGDESCRLPDLAGCDAKCKGHNMAACAVAGDAYYFGYGAPKDIPRAIELYKVACAGGDMSGCTALGIRSDDQEAIRLFSRVCDAGIANGCALAADKSRQADTAEEREKAPAYRKKSEELFMSEARSTLVKCNGGDARACEHGGELYQYGKGTNGRAKNTKAAITFYAKACDLGSVSACVKLGRTLTIGSDIAKDEVRATILYRAACNAGDLTGCAWLGLQYEVGAGAQQDQDLAISLYRRACDGGEPHGCRLLGGSYKEGRGVPRDPVMANQLSDKSCALGLISGCVQRETEP